MPKKINIGILGCANIAIRSIIPAISELNKLFNLKGIASRDSAKANDISAKFNTTPYHSYESLIVSNNIDAIYIPLPNSLHAIWIEKAIEKGIHVLVEKSMTCNLKETIRLNEAARKKNLVLFENFQFRFHSQLKKIKDIISEGAIGDLRCIRSSFGFPPFADKNNIRYSKELGGGALLDAGAYPIKISQILLGYNIEVKASTLFYDNKLGVDTWGGGFLQQKNGPLFSEIAFGFDQYYQCSLDIWGSKGKLTTNRIFTAPPRYEVEIKIENWNGTKLIKVEPDNHFYNMLAHFHQQISTKKEVENEYLQNINQARILEEFKNLAK